MLILSLELMAKTQDLMGNQLYRSDALQGVVIKYNPSSLQCNIFSKGQWDKQYLDEMA